MIALEILSSETFQNPQKLNTFKNRDSSSIKSRGGFVIHSGVHRSTAFVCGKEFPTAYASLEYWKEFGQAAENAWIVATVNGDSLETCELLALQAAFPAWKISTLLTKTCDILTAYRQDGDFEIRLAARDAQELSLKILTI